MGKAGPTGRGRLLLLLAAGSAAAILAGVGTSASSRTGGRGLAAPSGDVIAHIVFDGSGSATRTSSYSGGGGTTVTDRFSWHMVYDVGVTGVRKLAPGVWTGVGARNAAQSTFSGTTNASCTAPPGGSCVMPGGGTSCTASFANDPGLPAAAYMPQMLGPVQSGSVRTALTAHVASRVTNGVSGCGPLALDNTCDPYNERYGQPPSGAVIADFRLDLEDPNSTGTVPVSSSRGWSCGAGSATSGSISWNGTIQVGDDDCEVRLLAAAGLSLATPDCLLKAESLVWGGDDVEPVVQDLDGRGVKAIDDVKPPCGAPGIAFWVACSDPSKPDKVWPAAVVRGTRLEILQLTFRLVGKPFSISEGTLTGTGTLPGGATVSFKTSGVTLKSGQTSLTIYKLFSKQALPNRVAFVPRLAIKWTITQRRKPSLIQAGTTTLPLFVTLDHWLQKQRLDINGHGLTEGVPLYLSLLAIGTQGGSGATSESSFLQKLWSRTFAPRVRLARWNLDSGSGAITPGAKLAFWFPEEPWSLRTLFEFKYPGECQRNVLAVLQGHVASCFGMGGVFAALLATQGIDAKEGPVSKLGTFTRFADAQFFLVGNWTWGATGGSSDPRFPYVTHLAYVNQGKALNIGPANINYASAPAQNNTHAPGWWLANAGPAVTAAFDLDLAAADHELVAAGGKIWDPSFGHVAPSVAAWEKAYVVGWAKITDGKSEKPIDVGRCGKVANRNGVPDCYIEAHKGVA